MEAPRLLLFAGVAAIAGVMATNCAAQSAGGVDADALRVRTTSDAIGLESSANSGRELPLGLGGRYNVKESIAQAERKSDWSLGMSMSLNASRIVELSPTSGLGLRPKAAPGFVLEKRF